ncbi:hypothetical protein [Roseiconus lacunae]|uniref:WalW protein n=1 Tax=Roseiconus lacunae TaxID=2605694 RepID=A0ABT7PQP8_9BACT|nr:hypothetical protein [Roseiconus lacunae]MDM4018837.1 hypothetical protein [Roseiconus lacunae]
MKLIVSVDTEEDNAWDGRYQPSGQTVRNVSCLDLLQSLCDAHDVPPVYLVNNPIIEDDDACRWLSKQLDRGTCEVGAHLHPWCGPPHFRESYDSGSSFLCNLTRDEQFAKLAHLTDRIRQRLGLSPRSFRAGRYGLDHVGASLLFDLGYRIDSSVLPFRSCGDGGPDFSDAPWRHYHPHAESLTRAANSSGPSLLEIPVSVGYARAPFERSHRRWVDVRTPPWTAMRLPGLLHRAGIAKQIKATPEQENTSDICRLADQYLHQDADYFVILLHSSSLLVGGSPYSATASERDGLLDTLAAVLTHCVNRGITGATFSDAASEILDPQI